ncbi:hypothetical protein HPB50_025438 [Hyalomma asiaticum]|uniref:Uncharacterized protein n=1 Tax=Hyalomma asiaticum TaxID=266040 RepID=A0ACB7RM09_HYAAI|nr:hypothetical protein HPB50_025438 [Hyalomma asiaticum]
MVVQQDVEPPPSAAAEEKGEKKHKLRQRFQVIRKLGQGTYGKVQLAINRATNQELRRTGSCLIAVSADDLPDLSASASALFFESAQQTTPTPRQQLFLSRCTTSIRI